MFGFTWVMLGYVVWLSGRSGNGTLVSGILLGLGYGHFLPSLLLLALLGFVRRRPWWWLAIIVASPPVGTLLAWLLRPGFEVGFGIGILAISLLGFSLLALVRGYLVSETKESAALQRRE
jgi:hypothetical protein